MYVSIVTTMSRPDAVEQTVKSLNQIMVRNFDYELVIGIDNRNIVAAEVEKLLTPYRKKLRNLTILQTGNKKPRESDVVSRRNRISALHTLIQAELGASQFTFSYEDDTLLPHGILSNLFTDYQELTEAGYNVGLVQATQVGRWNHEYIGAFDTDNFEDPHKISTLPYQYEGLEAITAGGFYAVLTPTNLYKSHKFTWKEPLGPDYHYGLSLSRQGYHNFIDFQMVCGHITDRGILWPHRGCPIVTIERQGNRYKTTVKENK